MNKYFLSIISILLLFQSFKVFDEIFYHEVGGILFYYEDTLPWHLYLIHSHKQDESQLVLIQGISLRSQQKDR